MNFTQDEIIEDFPRFSGHMSIGRYLTLYELYKKTEGIAGHIAEVGTYKGSSLLWFTKLVQIYESESLTQVHGFDWDLVGLVQPAPPLPQSLFYPPLPSLY